jgi:hypothetical protein
MRLEVGVRKIVDELGKMQLHDVHPKPGEQNGFKPISGHGSSAKPGHWTQTRLIASDRLSSGIVLRVKLDAMDAITRCFG